jgi:hypothetical protein
MTGLGIREFHFEGLSVRVSMDNGPERSLGQSRIPTHHRQPDTVVFAEGAGFRGAFCKFPWHVRAGICHLPSDKASRKLTRIAAIQRSAVAVHENHRQMAQGGLERTPCTRLAWPLPERCGTFAPSRIMKAGNRKTASGA